jgi:hypothetical protein
MYQCCTIASPASLTTTLIQFSDASTHSRIGDWKVTRVEEYKTESPSSDFDAIVVCYCQYSPISTALEPLPNIQDSQKLQEV